MIIQTLERDVESTMTGEIEFRIKASAKAFSILSDKLYANKEEAIIRESATNARDSHVAAGKADVPFDVQLPNHLDPVFRIRDYGVGMSPETVKTVFTTLFESTKEDSNDFTGALGLGSKSYLSYTDAITVTSRYNGVKSVYTVYLNARRVPALTPVSQEPTDECNGVEVVMPVKARDFNTFHAAARKVFRWFPVKPRVSGVADFVIPEPPVVLEGTGWKLYERQSYSDRAMAVMGCVGYPLDMNALSNLSYEYRSLLESPFVFDFALGDLDITPSREALSYDERTIKHIEAAVMRMVAELPGKFLS